MLLAWLALQPAFAAEAMDPSELDHCRIIGIGEMTHGGAAEVAARSALTRVIAARSPVHLLLEAGVAEGQIAEEARRTGRSREAAWALGYWTWRSEELVDALDELDVIDLRGIDVQTPGATEQRLTQTTDPGDLAALTWALQANRTLGMPTDRGYGRRRDAFMAQAVSAFVDADPERRAVVWAHNGHVGRKRGRLGGHLDRTYGDDYCVVGVVVGEGEATVMTTDGRLVTVPIPDAPGRSLVDAFAGQPAGLYAVPRGRWSIPQVGVFLTGADYTRIRADKAFDAIYYLPETGPTHPMAPPE